MIKTVRFGSPLGDIRVTSQDGMVLRVRFVDDVDVMDTMDWMDDEIRQLEEYFRGKRTTFDVGVLPEGTDFDKRVWTELMKIPYGETRSYLDIANALGSPNSVRAVGHANGRNPIGIIIPCHRVIGASGELTGYAGGLHRKRWLLDHEARVSGRVLDLR